MNKDCIYSVYSETISGIFYYQEQQIELKIICLKLLLGTFAIIGGLLFSDLGLTSVELILICSILPLLSLFAVTVGLLHDLVYKERLKLGFFSDAIRFEKEYPWLPEFHKCLYVDTNIHKVSGTKQISFYFGCAGILIFISAVGFSLLPQFSSLLSRFIIGLIALAFFFFYYFLISKKIEKTTVLLKEMEEIENDN